MIHYNKRSIQRGNFCAFIYEDDLMDTEYSVAYKEYVEMEKELEGAKKQTPLYAYMLGVKEEGDHYEEHAYYCPKTRYYYVDALGGPFSKIGVSGKENNQEFSRFTEEEFVGFLHEKIESGEIQSLQELNGRHLLENLYKKHRLKFLFEKK